MYEFKLPDLGEGIHEGEILKWHVAAGDSVEEDAALVEVETDKAAVTIPSPRTGAVVSVFGKAGDTVTVGQVITTIDDGVDAKQEQPSVATDTPPANTATQTPVVAPATAVTAVARGAGRPVPAAPATRRLARELGIDINRVPPTGPAGRVTADDVQRFHAGPPQPVPQQQAAPQPPALNQPAVATQPQADTQLAAAAAVASAIPFLDVEPLPDFSQWGPVEREKLRSIRRRVAHKMVTSKVLVPHVAHMDDADVTELEAFRKQESKRREGQPGGHLTLLPFVVKAVTAGLKAAPAFNASLDPFSEELIYKRYYNIGIAADTGRGLIVPVVKQTDRSSIIEISAQIGDLVSQAREGNLDVQALRGGTFTITNVGPLGGTALIPAINYPEVAILGMGRVQEKPVVRDGEIVIRKILPLTLAFDHRVADGADAARFVGELVRQLSDPNLLLLET